jgi:hypothetical protein
VVQTTLPLPPGPRSLTSCSRWRSSNAGKIVAGKRAITTDTNHNFPLTSLKQDG